jgi:hypothetical protein
LPQDVAGPGLIFTTGAHRVGVRHCDRQRHIR